MEGWFSESQGQTINLKKKKKKRVVAHEPKMDFYEEELENENPEENPFLIKLSNFQNFYDKQGVDTNPKVPRNARESLCQSDRSRLIRLPLFVSLEAVS